MAQNPTVVFTKPRTVVIEDRPIPRPAEGQVLIKTRRTLISTGTELTILKGEFPPRSAWADYGKFPFIPGYNNIGECVDAGPGVDRSLVGMRFSSYGTHSMYVALPVGDTRPVRDDVSDDHAAFGTIADIAFNAVRRGEPAWGDSAVVYGLGLLGQFAVRALAFAGVRPVFAVDVVQRRIDLLPKHPGIVSLDPKTADVAEVVKKHTHGRMADIVYEITGAPKLIPSEFAPLKRQGRFVVVSSPAGTTEFDFHDLCNAASYTIVGAHISSSPAYETPYNQWTRVRNTLLFFDMVAGGEFDPEPLISHREDYSRAPALYQMLLEDRSKAMGVVLKWRD